jgi:hypothetical protein
MQQAAERIVAAQWMERRMDDIKKSFEHLATERGMPLTLFRSKVPVFPCYLNDMTQTAWEAWQEAYCHGRSVRYQQDMNVREKSFSRGFDAALKHGNQKLDDAAEMARASGNEDIAERILEIKSR